MLTLGHILEALTGYQMAGGAQVITDAVIDSRFSIPGALFVALPGERVDGHDYVGQAFDRGAVAALIQRDLSGPAKPRRGGSHAAGDILDLRQPVTHEQAAGLQVPVCLRVEDSLAALQTVARYWRNRLNIRVIGITGSVGKTTTKELIASVLQSRYRTLKNEGNLNNEIGLPLTLLKLSEAHERVVLEMGFYVPGEIAFLCEIARPHVGVITNVGVSHMEKAGSIEAIAAGKAELVESLPPDGTAILNQDDERVRAMSARTEARIFTYGLDPTADLWASDIEGLGLDGIRFRLHHRPRRSPRPWDWRAETLHIKVPLLGRHSVHTVLRAAAVGLVEGLTWQEIVEGLTSTATQLRLVAVRGPRDSLILDDTYNASPESTIAALNLLNELDGRKVAVLGDMLELGDFEEQGHRMVGVRAREVVQELVTFGERARIIADEARSQGTLPWDGLRHGLPTDCVIELEHADQVVEYLRSNIQAGDVVLIKGSRGMHMDRIVAALEDPSQ